MNPERLGNLLNEIELRLGRIGKQLGNHDGETHPNGTVARQIAALNLTETFSSSSEYGPCVISGSRKLTSYVSVMVIQ
jgi:hypothetical protein